MKRLRLLLWLAGAGALLCLALVAVALTPSFQTWVARRALAGRADMKASLGEVSAGINRTELRDLRGEFRGATLTIPRAEIEMPVLSAGWQRKAIVTRLTAHGWTLSFPNPVGVTPAPAGAQPASAEAAVRAFVGVFAELNLPLDVAVDGVDLQGEVILPESRGRVRVAIKGGGLAAGRDARFDVTAEAALTGGDVQSVTIGGTLTGSMATARSFNALAVRLDATATGPDFPGGARLRADARAARGAAGETYEAVVVTDGREVLTVSASFPLGAQRIDGAWRVQARDADLAPFSLGKPLPAFALKGEGTFDADAGFAAAHLAGRIEGSADRLAVLRRELEVLGPVSLNATFDLAHRGGVIAARQFEASLGAGGPVTTVRLLQEFEFNPGTRELRTAEVARDLLSVTLHGAPLAWARPWLGGLDAGSARLRGELFATPRNGGVTLRSRAPLAIAGLALAHEGRRQVEGADVVVSLAADYTPQGWQVEIPGLALKAGGDTLLTFEARAGRLAGAGQPLKATGRLIASLPGVLTQPAFAGRATLATGELEVTFAASAAERRELQAVVFARNLSAGAAEQAVRLPTVSIDLRMDAGRDNVVAFSAPVLLERDGRKSDLSIIGTLSPAAGLPPVIEALASGAQVFVEDAQVWAAIAAGPAAPGGMPVPKVTAGPPWSGLNGAIGLRLRELVFSDSLKASNITGRVRLDAGMVKLEGLQAGLGEAGRVNADGRVTFDASAPQPYALAVDLRLKEIDPAPLWGPAGQGDAAPVEGRFDLEGAIASGAAALPELPAAAAFEAQLTSKGGLFRVLPVNVAQAAENTGGFAAFFASIGSITGRKAGAAIAGRPEAVAEFVRALNPIAFDQLSMQLTRDAAGATTLRNLALIAPELRLTGAGTSTPAAGPGLLDDELAMEFRLRARGRQAELLKYLGLLGPKVDRLGYAECTEPFRVGGTVGQPDASELSRRFAAVALEKSGVAEKASELINRIIGGGK
ncbi:MAG: hypothetical protein JNL39_07120 [Opitutaceae bacterium]|nr:hypothetical protein [Opitutaceae bacterium]